MIFAFSKIDLCMNTLFLQYLIIWFSFVLSTCGKLNDEVDRFMHECVILVYQVISLPFANNREFIS